MRTLIAMLAGLASATAGPNVLFIAIDDLRPALGCYDDPVAITPHIDALAKRGTLFRRAYCQQAVCSPSRLSLLTGRRPDTIRVWDLGTHFRTALPDAITLPQHFKQNGYHVRSIGKILHGSGKPSRDAPSWSEPPIYDYVRDPAVRYATSKNLKGTGLKRNASESANVPDNTYIDGIVCDTAIQALDKIGNGKQPFFLAVGFRKPHLPFCAPEKYWKLYDRSSIPLPAPDKHPDDAPEFATRSWKELQGYRDIPSEGHISPAKVRELRHGYYACVSYIDALVGRLINHLSHLGIADHTVICLWGDHGFHLGEQGLWTKANNYELSTRVPLIIYQPGQPNNGIATDALVELVDIYPTLTDACSLSMPDGLEGISLIPLLSDPHRPWKAAAFSQYPRARKGHRHQTHGDIMGYTLRTDRFRYVEWVDWNSRNILARELYDEQRDPQETQNLAMLSAYQHTVKELGNLLARGWQAARPKLQEAP